MGKDVTRIIVGISGASGVRYGLKALELLRAAGVETHLVVTNSARLTMVHELDGGPAELAGRADHAYRIGDVGARIASGSFLTGGMLVAPCSIRTMSEIATGVTSTLVTRAADVVLKEKRRLVLALRETPLHGGHLRTLTTLADIGAVVAPIVPALYNKPRTVDDIINHTVGRLLDLFGIETKLVKRWQGGPTEE